MLLAKWLAVGPIIYSAIATRRRRLFDICSIPRKKIIRHSLLSPAIQQNFNSSVVIHVTFLIACYLIFIPAPNIDISGSRNASTKAAHYYGITPINVFNKTDLRMAENWFTLKSLDYEEVVPVFTEKGTRLQMHKSDRIYFGNTVRYRRGSIGKRGCISKPKMLDYLAKVYLSKKQVQKGEYYFKYRQYHQTLPDFNALSQGKYKKNKIEVRCDFEYQVSYKL